MAKTPPAPAAKTATAEADEMNDYSARETLLENAIASTEKILQLRESFNELIENGLLELARVRYSTGNKSAEEPSTEAAQSPSQRPASPSDPLRWFGVLVPQSLRRSQKYFVGALEVVVDVANEQTRLAAALDAYRASQPAGREAEP
ncbi:hypothetical protein MRX96_003994 [Rhipicephalus microplus]